MNFIQKKKSQSNIKDLIKVNHQANEFLEYILIEYNLKNDDAQNLDKLQQHLINMNVIFTNILDGLKTKKTP